MTANLETIVERIRADLERKNAIRDATLARSRTLIRMCANTIRAVHRHEFDEARDALAEAGAFAQVMDDEARTYPDLYYAGYLQDALKEFAEAAITLAVVTGEPLPEPEALGVGYAAYLNGLGEAMGEMRRFALDAMRRGNNAEAERLLETMDEVYSYLIAIDFPDALTMNLRRTTDMVRGVVERTRGDLTVAVGQEKLQASLQDFERRWDARVGTS